MYIWGRCICTYGVGVYVHMGSMYMYQLGGCICTYGVDVYEPMG